MDGHSTTKFTQEELSDFHSLLKEAISLGICPAKETYAKLRNYISAGINDDTCPLHDNFGLNRIVMAIKTCILAAKEIGLSGEILLVRMLMSVAESEDDCKRAGETFGQSAMHALSSMLQVRRLEAKTSAMKTDNFRNLLVSQAGDMRIVLMLIADNVCTMRHIKDTFDKNGQHHISEEAAYLYAPLAHKLGLYKLKSEMEDLSLKYMEHDAYYMIKEELNATKKSRDEYIERFIAPIRQMLDNEGLHYHMKGRTKSIHSIWQKMKKQHCGFSGVYDLFAIRIILDSPPEKEKEQCWKVFSLITNKYESNLKRLRDWLTVPKSNGYESLHITVRGPEDKWVEVQIRTERMDEIAEHGLAAHWRYKGVKSSQDGVDSWLADIREALEAGNESLLTKSLGSDLHEKNVYVFTPKGDLYGLPAGATVLDFAFRIHSAIGMKCTGGKVNGRNVPMRHKLSSGDMVEVTTSNAQSPKPEWLNFAVTQHARSKIKQTIRELQARDSVMARELLERKLKNRKLEWNESVINQLIKKTGFKESSEFFRSLYSGKIDINALIDLYVETLKRDNNLLARSTAKSAEEYNQNADSDKDTSYDNDVLVIDRNLKGVDFQMARCCNPVYGDDVFGFVTVGGGIKIHRTSCPNAHALKERFGYRIVKARWAGKGGGKYPITLHIVGQDDLGIVNNITSIISKEEKMQLRSINIDSNDGLFYGILTVMVENTDMLNMLMKKLRTVKGVKAVSRS